MRVVEVVLLKAVETLGAEGTVVRVAPGFARNFLIPRGLAVPATETQVKLVAARAQAAARQAGQRKAQAETLKQQLERFSLTLPLTVGREGKPFGSVTAHDLVAALARQGLALEKPRLRLERPIKTLGVHQIPVRLHPDVTATLTVTVVSAS